MRIAHTFLLAVACVTPAMCRAQAKCPWISEATARGILGGPVVSTIKLDKSGGGVCDYSRQQGAAAYRLRITVEMMSDIPKQFAAFLVQCPPKSDSLVAIGNEAVVCSVEDKTEGHVERVVSRVREQAFIINLSSPTDDAALTPALRREKVRLAAEQVSGILF